MLVAMADSKEVESSKGKGRFISDTYDMITEVLEVFNSNPDVTQFTNKNPEPSDSKGKMNPDQLNALLSNIIAKLSDSDFDNDPKGKQLLDLVKNIRDLLEKVNEQKEWALRTVTNTSTRLYKHYLELQELRMEKEKRGETENKTDHLVKSLAVKITEENVKRAGSRASAITATIRSLELENAQIRADTQAYRLSASEYEKDLSDILKRGKKCMKKLADVEKESKALKAQHQKELLRAEQLEQDLVEAEKEAGEVEIQWRQEVKEKERMLALVAEETRKEKTRKASSRAYLSELRQQVEADCQVAENECRRLEDELSRLRVSRTIDDILPENLDFLYNSNETASSSKLKSYLCCMMCMENAVSVLFLPCTHQVLCFSCYKNNCKALGGHCSYCNVEIDEAIKTYGPRS